MKYRIIISALLGFASLLQFYFPIVYDIQGFALNVIWHRLFILLVALAWGPIYAMTALLLGLSGLMEFVYFYPAGWKAVFALGYYVVWLGVHGYCAIRRREDTRLYFNVYFVQSVFLILHILIMMEVRPVILNNVLVAQATDETLVQSVRTLLIIKVLVNEFILVALADSLLMLPSLRKFFRLSTAPWQKYNAPAMLLAVFISMLFTFLASGMCEVLLNQDYGLAWLTHPNKRLQMALVLSIVFGIITGGIGIRFLERKLAADDELRRSEEKWRSLFDGMQDIYLEENLDGIVTMVSPSIHDHLGYSPAEVVGKKSSFIYAETETQATLFSAYRTCEILLNREVRFQDKAGGIHWMALNSMKRKDATGENKIIVIAKDITELKEAMNEIRDMNLRLEQRVVERTEELESFVYNVSHDLKSPLRSIEGYSRFIREDYANELNPDALMMVKNIQYIALDMIKLIDKLLEYVTTTKIDTITKERIDMQELLVTVFDELRVTCPERTVCLDIVDTLPCLMADRILLKQVIINIFSNAVKFTRGKNPARIRVECHRTNKEYVFSVRDNGVGFDMEYAQKLFGIFQRLHSKEEFEGFGIGLATVRNLIEKHGGRTWIQGKEDEGTAVFFSLPICE